jgi:GNAT superfamily N-acetyltransferase
LSRAGFSAIGDPCGHCGFGTDESGPPAWVDEVTDLWGICGVAAQANGDIEGYLTFAPAELVPMVPLPGPGGSSADAFTPDAAVFMAVSVCRQSRGHGVARDLVRSAAAQLAKRQIGMIEVIGTVARPGVPYADGSSGSSMVFLPVSFWQSQGFRVVRPHPITPTLRLDIEATVRWRPDFAGAWQRFAELVSQTGTGPAQPASYTPALPGIHRRMAGLPYGGEHGQPAHREPAAAAEGSLCRDQRARRHDHHRQRH